MGGAELEVKAEMLAHSKLAELVGLSEEQLHQAALLEEEQAAEEREKRRQKASGKAEARQNVVIGSAQISLELFDIFSTETRQCMAALAPKKCARCSLSKKYAATAPKTRRPMAYLERQNGGGLSPWRC